MRISSFRIGDIVTIKDCPVEEYNGRNGEIVKLYPYRHETKGLLRMASVEMAGTNEVVNFNENYLTLLLRVDFY